MRTAFFALSLFAVPFTSASAADEKPKPNTLTAKEIADGWILLFDGETTFGWNSSNMDSLKVENGTLTNVGGKWFEPKAQFGDCELHIEHDSPSDEGFIGVARSSTEIRKAETLPVFDQGLKKHKGWSLTTFRVKGKKLISKTTTVDTEFGSEQDFKSVPDCGQHLMIVGQFKIRSVKMRPLNHTPLSLAKDLAAWKEIPDKKSKFAVTREGELNIKDGPGDIQSVDQYDDFILQLDINSNGDKLNSGVFFRCLPGEFWSGYEAQIRNEWVSDVTLNDGTKLTGSYTEKGDQVELKICEVKEKKVTVTKEVKKFAKSEVKEVKHRRDLPIDFGTGGVYNQQPARKVVSSDREWFTMTVIAHGNHIAVWVNGYQVSDFTDTRPADKSARKGAKTDKGPISLQGHDPTTDLSFRNIRIAELPKGEKK